MLVEEDVTDPILAVAELAELAGLKLARELLDENVPLEAGRMGEAKLDMFSCLESAGGLNSCGIIPMSVMCGFTVSGGVWGLIITWHDMWLIMWSLTGRDAPQTRKRIIFHPCSCQQRKTFLRFAEKVMTIFNQNINEKLSNLIRHRNWEALHYMLKVALCNKILVKFVFFRSEVPREWLCPA